MRLLLERLTTTLADQFGFAGYRIPCDGSRSAGRPQSAPDIKFYGVRIDGRIAAMAGERMRQEGHAEVSGVCCHPDFRGQGLGRLLSIFVTHRIRGHGETPYLHTYAANAAAIGL